MVQKLDESMRVYVDYIALNECTVKDSFPLHRIVDLLDKLLNAKCMTHLNLGSPYNQVTRRCRMMVCKMIPSMRQPF